MALVASASALALLLSGCDQTKDSTPAADQAATPTTAAASADASKDCNAPGVSCTPAERDLGHTEGMHGSEQRPGMEGSGYGPGMAGRDSGTRMGGPPERR